MKKMKMMVRSLLLVSVFLFVGCSDSDKETGLTGKYAPTSASFELKAKTESAQALDAIIAQMSQKFDMPITTLNQLNQFASIALEAIVHKDLKRIEFSSGGTAQIITSDDKVFTTQYTVRDDVFAMAIPKELTGLEFPLPIECRYKNTDGKLELYLLVENISSFVDSPLFTPIVEGLIKEIGDIVTVEQVKMVMGMLDSLRLEIKLGQL